MNLYCSFAVALGIACVGLVGGFETWAPACVEPTLKYHPCDLWRLTAPRYPGPGPCMAGSLTGAVASQSVTEAREGWLRADGNRSSSAMA